MRALWALWWVGTLALAERAEATTILKQAFTIYDDPSHVFKPEDASFLDDQHLLIVFSQGQLTNGVIEGAGQFFRVYDVATEAFSAPIMLDSPVEESFGRPVAVAGRGGIGRILYLVPTGVDLGLGGNQTAENLLMLAVDSDGNPLGGGGIRVNPVNANVASADVALLADGRCLVVWWETQTNDRRFKLFGRLYGADMQPLGGEFTISDDDVRAAFPRISADTNFNIVFDDRPTGSNQFSELVLVSLAPNGAKQWTQRITDRDATLGTVTTLDGGQVYVAYSARTNIGTPSAPVFDEDTYVKLYLGNGELRASYRLPIPRAEIQRLPDITTQQGSFASIAYGSSSGLNDSVDLVTMDLFGTPVDADPPIVDNSVLGTLEANGAQRAIVAGSHGDVLALLYNAERLPSGINAGSKAKMILFRAGPPRCPPDLANGCGNLVPFHITGNVANRLNLVIAPSKYASSERVAFQQQLREHVLVNLRYGSQQHRTRYDRFNIFFDPTDADIPLVEPFFACPRPLEIERYSTQYPWVRAVGAQLNPAVYFDSTLMKPRPPTTACAETDTFANGGGTFIFPGYAVGAFEHELAHSMYGSPDEYQGGLYLEDSHPGPFPSQYRTLPECQGDATAEGWSPADCYQACVRSDFPSCGRDWFSAELRPPPFKTLDECQQWRTDHAVIDPCASNPDVPMEFTIPTLRDLMVSADVTIATPASRTLRPLSSPAPSFQRACERRALFYLDDPQLMQSLGAPTATSIPVFTSSVSPFIIVGAKITGTLFDQPVATLVNEVRGPRFETFGQLRVLGMDSDDTELIAERRGDVRIGMLEQLGAVSKPDGTSVVFSVDVVPGLRRMRVLDSQQRVLLDVDLGPTLVAACANQLISADLCATFDSDGDGCRDIADTDPLVPETEPPSITGTITPSALWPPNHKLREVHVGSEVRDNCTDHPNVVLESATSSQPDMATPGDPSHDIADADFETADFDVRLRAERTSKLGPRTYSLTYRVTDRAGNTARATFDVVVLESGAP